MTDTIIDQLSTELTPTQRRYARNILAVSIEKSSGTLKENIIEVCKNLDNAGIPKQLISKLVCEEYKSKLEISEQYLRRIIPVEYKNERQRENRLYYGETKVSPTQIVEVKSKEDIEPLIPMTMTKVEDEIYDSNNDNREFETNSNLEKISKLEDSDLQGIALDKLPEEFRPFMVKLIKENKLLKASNMKLREQVKDLKFEDNFKQDNIDTITRRNKEFMKNFEDNYKSVYDGFKARIAQVEEKNDSFHYMLVGLAGISEPGISDEMRVDTVNNFIKRHYDKIIEQTEKYKQERSLIEAENLKSWE